MLDRYNLAAARWLYPVVRPLPNPPKRNIGSTILLCCAEGPPLSPDNDQNANGQNANDGGNEPDELQALRGELSDSRPSSLDKVPNSPRHRRG